MNERDNAILQSTAQVVDICTRKEADFADFPVVKAKVTELTGYIAEIREQNNILEVSTKGYTENKNAARVQLIAKALAPVLTRIQAFASINRDDVLKNAVKFNDSKISKMADTKLASTCRNIIALAREKQPLMASVGLTEALIDLLDTSVADFEARLLGTPQYIGEQKAAKQKREKALNACEDIMNNDLDVIAEIIKLENPETYAGYQHARKLKLMGRRTMALKIKVVESGSQASVPGVNITIAPDTNGDALKATADLTKNVKRTSALGGCQLKNLPEGKYLITAEKAGWAPQSAVVYINAGEMSSVKLELTALQN